MSTYLRNADLANLVEVLQRDNARKHDLVVPAADMHYEHGQLVIPGYITPTGIGSTYTVNQVAQSHLAERLGIPKQYWERMTTENVPLLDDNVNKWLAQDARGFLVRTFRDDDGGVARAICSDKYRATDDWDALLATLEGIKESGVDAKLVGADVSDRRTHARFVAPVVAVAAGDLLERYRFGGKTGKDLPLIFAGFEFENSEVGEGAYKLTPRLVVQICTNGMKRDIDAMKSIHIGHRLEAGVVEWSHETQEKHLDLIKAKTKDAVKSFLSQQYVQSVVTQLETMADTELTEPAKVIEVVCKQLKYSEEASSTILSHFIKGGDASALGLGHALTSFAQQVPDAEQASAVESDFWKAMELAVAAN